MSHELKKHDTAVIYSSIGPGGNCGVFAEAAEVPELIAKNPEQLRKYNAGPAAQRDQAAGPLHAEQHGRLSVMAGECCCATQLTQRCRRGPGLFWKPWPGPSRTVLNYFATGTARMQTGLPTFTERPVGSRAPVC